MKQSKRTRFYLAAALLAAFALWTLAVCTVDVGVIGPLGSSVGLASLNRAFHTLTGVHMMLYAITDWLGLVPVAVAAGFAVLGLVQWIKRKHILRVDRSVRMLGGFYLAVMAAYIFFEAAAVNYRPVLIEGAPEVSYPSSTTLLTLCVMPTAAMQLCARIRNKALRLCTAYAIAAFTAYMVIGRLLSGVHWLSDIVGGVLLSAGLVMLYASISD